MLTGNRRHLESKWLIVPIVPIVAIVTIDTKQVAFAEPDARLTRLIFNNS